MKKYKYSETFFSPQGEGKYTGHPSVWIRFFLCNLQCDGFGQKDPTDPDTYELPYETLDVTDITRVEDLPVFDKGCDSSYTWAKKYRHLMHEKDAVGICDELTEMLPTGAFRHFMTGQQTHLCFTGGEPMLNQQAILEILQEFERRGNIPRNVTVETNGTKPLTNAGREAIDIVQRSGGEWFWSVSPKLWTTAGEKPKKAIRPDVIYQYADASPVGQLKYVVNGSEESWEEVKRHTMSFRLMGCQFPVWIMSVGATEEEQVERAGDIAVEANQRGYCFSGRLHTYLFGNQIGT